MLLPAQLLDRLGDEETAGLGRFMNMLAHHLVSVYSENLLDYQESRGDDGQVYGFRVYKHLRYALMTDAEDDEVIEFVEQNGAYYMAVGPLRIRVDSLGHFANEDVRHAFPDASPTKQAFGRRNADQLRLDLRGIDPVPDDDAFELNALTAGHFGNPREGFVKWYLGAWTELPDGRKAWAWIERQDDADDDFGGGGGDIGPLAPRAPLPPFDQRQADEVIIRPRKSA